MCTYTSPTERTPSPGRQEYFDSGMASARLTIFFSTSSSCVRNSARNPVGLAESAACRPVKIENEKKKYLSAFLRIDQFYRRTDRARYDPVEWLYRSQSIPCH